jgi:hypothetical protein
VSGFFSDIARVCIVPEADELRVSQMIGTPPPNAYKGILAQRGPL